MSPVKEVEFEETVISSEEVVISKDEYDQLKRKAELYDMYQKQLHNSIAKKSASRYPKGYNTWEHNK